ncbi:MAG: BBP7 family outer membrane beta-barrel protein [Pirellulales bacterium]|nr:BBP7 family outer membrane beta-barrel protein [Pirellulales bacterium]
MDDSLARSLMGALLCGIALTNQAGFAGDDVVAIAPLVETPTVFAEDLAANPLDAIEQGFDDVSFTCPPVGCLQPFTRPPSWGQVDFLLMWRRPPALPPLVTTSPPGTPLSQAGQLNQPTTTTLLGGRSQASGPSAGGRIDFGYWLNTCPQVGIGGRFLALGDSSLGYAADSTTTPILARPFLNVTDGQTAAMDTLIVSFPDEATGEIEIQGTSTLIIAEAYLRRAGNHNAGTPGDLVGGYQFSRIDGSLEISSHSTALSTSQLRVPGTTLEVLDSITTQNEFHGGQLGVLNDWNYGGFTIFGSFQLGLGNMR